MATVYGVNATNLQNQTIAQLSEQGEYHGRLRVIYDEFTLTADLASGDVIRMGGKIPSGARIIDVIFYTDNIDASGGTVDIGWLASDDAVEAADADGFMDDVAVTAAAAFLMSDDEGTRPGLFKRFTADCQAAITVDGDTDASSGSVKLCIKYVVD